MKIFVAIAFAILVGGLSIILLRATDQPIVTAATNEASPVAPESTPPPQPAVPEAQPAPAAAASVTPPVTPPNADPEPPGIFIPLALQEVVAMVKGGVDSSVIEAYIKNSGSALQPNVNEILYLNRQKVPKELISAMIQQGAEQKVRDAKAAKAAAAQVQPIEPVRPPVPAPQPIQATQPIAAASSPAPYYAAPTVVPVVVNAPTYLYPTAYPYYQATAPGYVFFSFGSAGLARQYPSYQQQPLPGNYRAGQTPNSPPMNASAPGRGQSPFIAPFKFIGQSR